MRPRRSEALLLSSRGEVALGVLRQQQALAPERLRGRGQLGYVSIAAAVAFRERSPRVFLGSSVGGVLGERQEAAVAVAQFAGRERRRIDVPARVGRKRHDDVRKPDAGTL